MAELFGYRYQLSIGSESEFLDLQLNPGNITTDGRNRARNPGPGVYADTLTSGLRISFLVNHDFGGAQSLAEISVYNLSTETEAKIFGEYRLITLQAGWPEMFGVIFKGEIVNYQRIPGTNDGTHGIKLFCRSSAYSLKTSYINQSFSPQSDVIDLIRTAALALGNPVEIIGDFSDIPKRTGGTFFKKPPAYYLNTMAKDFGFTWGIENGITRVLRNGAIATGNMYYFSSQTGMIGSPVVTDTEVNVRVALNPMVRLASNVQIKSLAPDFSFSGAYYVNIPRSIGDGVFQVRAISHVGDSYSPIWETHLACFRLADVQRDNISERASR